MSYRRTALALAAGPRSASAALAHPAQHRATCVTAPALPQPRPPTLLRHRRHCRGESWRRCTAMRIRERACARRVLRLETGKYTSGTHTRSPSRPAASAAATPARPRRHASWACELGVKRGACSPFVLALRCDGADVRPELAGWTRIQSAACHVTPLSRGHVTPLSRDAPNAQGVLHRSHLLLDDAADRKRRTGGGGPGRHGRCVLTRACARWHRPGRAARSRPAAVRTRSAGRCASCECDFWSTRQACCRPRRGGAALAACAC